MQIDAARVALVNGVSAGAVDAAREVYRQLGPGLLERVYADAFRRELTIRGTDFSTETYVPVVYKGRRVGPGLRVDFLLEGCVLVEVKSCDAIIPAHRAQVLTYLRLLRLPAGLIVNFGAEHFGLATRRILLDPASPFALTGRRPAPPPSTGSGIPGRSGTPGSP